MRVLITGAGGQLGQALLALPPRADLEWLPFTRAQLDITDRQTVQRLVAKYRPDVIINTAAYTGVDKAETDSEQAFTVNAKGPEILAQVCAEHQVALVQLSTDFVFSGSATQPYTEADTTGPQSVYGCSKLAGEQAVLKSPGVQALVLRTSWLCSRYGDNFVKTRSEILAQVCAEHQVALLQLSTDFVFSGSATQPYTEADTTGPQSVYGRSKLAGEQAVLKSPGVQALVLRTSWLCSRYGDNFVKTLLAKMQQGHALQVVNDQIGSFTLADDLAGWIVEL